MLLAPKKGWLPQLQPLNGQTTSCEEVADGAENAPAALSWSLFGAPEANSVAGSMKLARKALSEGSEPSTCDMSNFPPEKRKTTVQTRKE
jgi:hypothetical protein